MAQPNVVDAGNEDQVWKNTHVFLMEVVKADGVDRKPEWVKEVQACFWTNDLKAAVDLKGIDLSKDELIGLPVSVGMKYFMVRAITQANVHMIEQGESKQLGELGATADGSTAMRLIMKALKKEEPVAHIDIHSMLQTVSFDELGVQAWPDGDAVDELANANFETSQKGDCRSIHLCEA